MPRISISEARPGMRTSAPVTDSGGQLLVKEGVELTEEVIERLRLRRVTSIEVGDAAPVARPLPPPDAAALEHAFEKSLGSPVMKALYEAARARSGAKA
jgi:hypothetical protein